jgi:hypothetical protein
MATGSPSRLTLDLGAGFTMAATGNEPKDRADSGLVPFHSARS